MANNSRSSRDIRQEQAFCNWRNNQYNGIIVAATGFGKTQVGILASKSLSGGETVLVVVPTTSLQEQWKQRLDAAGIKDYEVFCINSAYKFVDFTVDLLILDEIHLFAADEFRKVFEGVECKKLLGLTATLERGDGKHDIILEHTKVVDNIPLDECLINGWVAPFTVYNVAVPMSEEEKVEYNKAEKSFRYTAMRCGFGGMDSFRTAMQWLKTGTGEEKGTAMMYIRSMKKRKEICYHSKSKLAAAKVLAYHLKSSKILTFSQSIDSAKELVELIGSDVCTIYHSKMGKKAKEAALKEFTDSHKRIISSVKALNTGTDVPDCSVAIILAASSTKITDIQTIGRAIRPLPDKTAMIFNLYLPGTQDESWLKKRQDAAPYVPVWTNLSEVLTLI